jgi:hypothetical protein
MTISTAECELTITFTEEEHEELCTFKSELTGSGCSRPALYAFVADDMCDCVHVSDKACQRCRDDFEKSTLYLICVYCKAPIWDWRFIPLGKVKP